MANRNLLHRDHLQAFCAWLKDNGWELLLPIGTWELVRATSRARDFKNPLIVYQNNRTPEHLSVHHQDVPVVRLFIKSLKEAQRGERAKV